MWYLVRLQLGNAERDTVHRLYTASQTLTRPNLNKFPEDTERSSIGELDYIGLILPTSLLIVCYMTIRDDAAGTDYS